MLRVSHDSPKLCAAETFSKKLQVLDSSLCESAMIMSRVNPIHTQHTSLTFNEYLFHLYDCKCLNLMCVLKLIMIKSKRFLVFIFVFGSDFHHSCFEVFIVDFVIEKLLFGCFHE